MNTQKINILLKYFLYLPIIFVFGILTIIGSGGGGGGDEPPPPAPTTYSITGKVSGGIVENITITLGGAIADVTTTDNNGNFSFTGLDNGNYTLTPSMPNYTFTPATINLTINDANSTGNNFTSIGILAGTVSGDIVNNVTIELTGTAFSTHTDAGGDYSFEGLPNDSYTITPIAAGFSFNPISTIVNFTGVASTGNDFTATAAVTYNISGTISGDIMANVPVNISGGTTGSTVTDSNGDYSFTGLAEGLDYTVTPDRTDFTFDPLNMAFNNLTANQTGADFSATNDKPDLTRYSISGNISSTGAQTDDIHIMLQESSSGAWIYVYGTTIEGVGAYTIRGVPEQTPYKVVAYMDSLDNGAPNASDPYGTITIPALLGDVANIDITLTDPASPTPVAPGIVLAFPYDQGAAVLWQAPMLSKPNDDLEYEVATSYTLYWDTSPNVGPANNLGSATIPAKGEDMGNYFVNGLTNGQGLYFGIRANVNGSSSSVTATSSPATIGATTGGSTVSGTINFTGAAGDPLYVILFDFESAVPEVYLTRIPAAASPQAYSVSGLANGNYYLLASLDVNGNNIIDTGDLEFNSEWRLDPISVNNSNVVRDETLNSDNSVLRVRTGNNFELTPPAPITHHSYEVNPELLRGVKRATRVAITNAPGINTPVDINSHEGIGEFQGDFGLIPKPYVGDSYTYEVTYADSSTATLTQQVKVLLESYPTPTNPVGDVPLQTHPTFTWTAPAAPPTQYFYNINVYSSNVGMWDLSYLLPSTTLSVEYNVDGEATQDPLTSGTTYWWHLNLIDPDENRIVVRTEFTP